MASEVPFRQRFCRAADCGEMFFVCRPCYRGQAYCRQRCRRKARRQQRRRANQRYQADPEVRQDHRDQQREYRKRLLESRVTDQSSIIECGSGSITEPLAKIEAESPAVEESQDARQVCLPKRFAQIICVICGRVGKFVTAYVRRE